VELLRRSITDTGTSFRDTVFLLTRDGLGSAEPPLQRKLLLAYLSLLVDNGSPPAAICFYTDGVKLVVEGSPVLDVLRSLERQGVRLIACSTCLGYFGLTERVRVGLVAGMPDIIEAQQKAAKVITL
jgi:intracellular sulfur oxidation DsrE/DsrF family protein